MSHCSQFIKFVCIYVYWSNVGVGIQVLNNRWSFEKEGVRSPLSASAVSAGHIPSPNCGSRLLRLSQIEEVKWIIETLTIWVRCKFKFNIHINNSSSSFWIVLMNRWNGPQSIDHCGYIYLVVSQSLLCPRILRNRKGTVLYK